MTIRITDEMLPVLAVGSGAVEITRPLPLGAILSPALAIKYATSLIQAAADAEGKRKLDQEYRSRRR